ncbi:hypothetical protein Salat_2521800 [Sesamum alatum]|uniref:Uncharacterized protein n=1 Tax=Sesamum alatum TaxID=300844 RepID=A0AAE1XRZ6_9LAMI|nr:hypothetical protein Salat_2521800 [Sesamum alatum]
MGGEHDAIFFNPCDSLSLAQRLGSRLHYNLSHISQLELDVFFGRDEPKNTTQENIALDEKAHDVSVDRRQRSLTAAKKISQTSRRIHAGKQRRAEGRSECTPREVGEGKVQAQVDCNSNLVVC